MHNLDSLCYMLDDNIGHITQRGGDISANELDMLYKATKTMYYIKVMKAMEEVKDDYGYSGKRMEISYDGHPRFDEEYSTRSRRYYDDGKKHGDNKDEMRRHLEMAMDMAQTEPERQNIASMLKNL